MKRIICAAISIAVVLVLIPMGGAINSTLYAASGGNDVIKELFAGWSSHDAVKVAAVFTDDAVYEDVTAGHISRGRAEVRKWAEGAFVVFEDFKMEFVSGSFANGRGFAEWVWSGTDKGLLKTGKKFSVRGVSVYEVRRGKISSYKEFYDFATVMRQVGVLPPEKERAEKALDFDGVVLSTNGGGLQPGGSALALASLSRLRLV